MVESERSHRSGRRRRRSAAEFFLCFSSRSSSSSSSMKISSKSILSPGRSREPSLSLSSSLSRRLRSNGSMKGGQASPMFPTGSKKKGSSFEPPEPSSPKVTCIGQVRVKSKKKHGRKLRNRSQRRGEVSFRKTEHNQDGNGIHHQQQQSQSQECLPHRNQRWVHLPLSICETLKAFGAEFNCFHPCGGRSSSSCSWTSEREKVEKTRGSNGATGSSGSCGAVFARWLFALQENEEKGREIEAVVMREEEKRVEREVVREIEMEISEEKLEITKGEIEVEEEEEEEEGRESICIPPKNALLLMRSRSAPFRMSSLANRFWESPAPQDNMEKLELEEEDDEEDELDVNRTIIEERHGAIEEEEGNKDREVKVKLEEEETKEEEMVDQWDSAGNFEEDTNLLNEEEIAVSQIKVEEDGEALECAELRHEEEQVQEPNEAVMVNGSLPGEGKLQIKEREEELKLLEVEEEDVKEVLEKRRVSFSASSTMYFEPESEEEEEEEAPESAGPLEETAVENSTEEEVSEEEKEISTSRSSTEQHSKCQEGEESKESETETSSLLPECLLLMMCEPKLSMEVSKETWVCSTDFVKFRHPEKKAVQKNGADESIKKKRLSKVANPVFPTLVAQQPQQQQQKQTQIQPARSSYSKVEPVVAKSMGTVVEKKLVNAGVAYEPFVLKRCKSEPMRNSAKLAPEVSFWKKNKLEPHPPPSVGIGATGIGF